MGEEQFRPGCDRRDDSAECVMLNNGPYILDAVATLADILDRMTGHHDKKNFLLRPLRSWRPAARISPGDHDLANP